MLRKIVLSLFLCITAVCAAQDITGQVIDIDTREPVPFATLKYRGRKLSTVCDHAGRFAIERREGWTLVFSSVGYKTERIQIEADTEGQLLVMLRTDSKELDEVTVKSKRAKYSRKNNPAVELMRRVIAAKRRTDIDNNPFYEYQNYQKITLAVNDIKPDELEKGLFKRSKWMTAQVEYCALNGKLTLPVSVDETVTRHIYRRDPHNEKDIIIGQRSEGVNHLLQTGEMLNTVLKDAFTDIDIYDDQIRLLRHPFTSPIGKDAINFYRYYIVDTVAVGGDTCYHLDFLPNNQQDFGFRGELYILADTTLHVRQCNMWLPKSSDVNFVENLWIKQEYTRLSTGDWVLTTDDMIAEMAVLDVLPKALVTRVTRKDGYSFEPIEKKLFRGKTPVRIDPDANMRDNLFWHEHRKEMLTDSEYRMGNFLKAMQEAKGYSIILAGFKLLVENFIETGGEKHPSKVDIGPINTIASSNFIDGLRVRASAQTTANLCPHLFFKGYYAHGFKSDKNYYSALFVYTLNKKNYTFDEFPRRNLSFETTYDVYSPSDKFLQTDKDNVFTSVKWTDADKMMFYNRQRVHFEYETEYNLSLSAQVKTERNEACGTLQFITLDREYTGALTSADNLHNGSIRTTDITLAVRYAPGEKYMNTKQRRVLVNQNAPVFRLSHTTGFKGFLGSDYSYNLTELSAYKRFWLNSWGKLEVTVNAGMQWNQVPFPLLIMPANNLSYIADENTFSMISDMEFLHDRYVSLSLAWDMKGKVFNRIPLLRRLKWREYIGFRALWADLSDKNNPYAEVNSGNSRLMYFPDETSIMKSSKPYMEFSVGVHNIFKVLQVQYVRRLTYNDLPTAHKHGIRFMFNFTF